MAAAYDTYDYPSYWLNREYEHGAEIVAIKSFLEKINKIDKFLEIGAGFGRITPTYIYRAKKVILADPSAKLLALARERFPQKKIRFIQSRVENLPGKIRNKTLDVVALVRVLHHMEDLDQVFAIVNGFLQKGGFFILEFPNKCHFKARLAAYSRGDFTFGSDIFRKDLRSKRKKKQSSLPFFNYHPFVIGKKLKDNGFKVISKRSVSNIRSPFLKRYLTLDTLLSLEKYIQLPLAKIDFGPSIFILAQKKG